MTTAYVLAANYRGIGLTFAALVLIAYVALFFRNVKQAKPELGSEVELAANRKPYLSDEELEGPKLDKALSFALVCLTIVAIIIPFYWLAEPGRQEGMVDAYRIQFESRGSDTYFEGAACADCHAASGAGGSAAYVLQDIDGQFISNASWTAPALNNILHRYSEDEVAYIINYGRSGSPMAAWGVPGGGPLTEQQVEELIVFLRTLQTPTLDPIEISESENPDEAAAQAAILETEIRNEVQRSLDAGEFDTLGEAVFNLGFFSGYGAGSLSCGRCHTSGWSLGPAVRPQALEPGIAGCGGGDPSGIGYSLCGNRISSIFPDDSWKLPDTGQIHIMESSEGSDGPVEVLLDGSWLPQGGLIGADGRGYLLGADGETRIQLDEKGTPIVETEDGPVSYQVLDDGNLAYCQYISNIWEPGGVAANSYPIDSRVAVMPASQLPAGDDSPTTGGFVDPEEITAADLRREFGGQIMTLGDGRLAADCEITEMPERTSQAHFDFVAGGADAGSGYGRGGQSDGGMMPGFGGLLPRDFIQAVVDYERGL